MSRDNIITLSTRETQNVPSSPLHRSRTARAGPQIGKLEQQVPHSQEDQTVVTTWLNYK